MNHGLWWMFRGLYLCYITVIFPIDCCITKPWSSSTIPYNNTIITHNHHTHNNPSFNHTLNSKQVRHRRRLFLHGPLLPRLRTRPCRQWRRVWSLVPWNTSIWKPRREQCYQPGKSKSKSEYKSKYRSRFRPLNLSICLSITLNYSILVVSCVMRDGALDLQL